MFIFVILFLVLLQQVLISDFVFNIWVEVLGVLFESVDGMVQLVLVVCCGYCLLCYIDLVIVCGELVVLLDVCSFLCVSVQEVFEILCLWFVMFGVVFMQCSFILLGQLYEGVCNCVLVEYCLDEVGVWGILGWFDDDVLYVYWYQFLGCDVSVIVQICQVIGLDSLFDFIECLVW